MLETIVKKLSCVALASASLLPLGCTTYLPMDLATKRPAEPLPDKLRALLVPEPFDTVEDVIKDSTDGYDEYTVSLLRKGKVVTQVECVESKLDLSKKNWVILYPILGGEDLLLVGHIARNVFAPEGINSAIVMRKELFIPDEGPYRPLRSSDPDVVDFEKYNYVVIKDTQRIVQYIKDRGMQQFGLMGISLGGMQVAGTAPFVRESKIDIMVMAGGDIGQIIMNSTEKPVQTYKKYLVSEYGGEQNARIALADVRSDPLKLAKYIPTENVRMVLTTNDTAVPTECQWFLYYELGRPTTLLVPTNHYTLILDYFEVRNFIVNELKQAFGDEK